MSVLDVQDLTVTYGRQAALEAVSFGIGAGESFGLVGESGSGKSTVALAVMRYLPANGRIAGGALRFEGQDLLGLSPRALRAVRGKRLAMVYQDPGSALNPAMTIGDQIAEVFRVHEGMRRSDALEAARGMLGRVQMRDPGGMMRRYPHQLSGGQQQRVVIALALATNPALLILDEPTTGLDATVEAAVLDLVAELRREYGTAILFISHNLAIVARMCDRIGVLYAGRIVEEGPTRQVFYAPRHPYTLALLGCVPRFGVRKHSTRLVPIAGQMPRPGARGGGCTFASRCSYVRDRCRQSEPPLLAPAPDRRSRCFFWEELPPSAADYIARVAHAQAPEEVGEGERAQAEAPVLETTGLMKVFPNAEGHTVRALDGVSLRLGRGRTFGLVGESGSGKSTLARVVAGLLPASAGRVSLDGADVTVVAERRSREMLKRLQMVFQSPEATLNPQHRIGSILARSVRALTGLRGEALRARVRALAEAVNLDLALLESYPRELSGGQRQRVAIARAFAGDPEVVLCDEPASALDVSVQAAILNLLVEIQEQRHASYIFISHDLTVVRYLADEIAVMYLGHLVEVGPAERVFRPPFHPYTELLFSAIPVLDLDEPRAPEAHAMPPGATTAMDAPAPSPGEAPQPPGGCPFRLRCPRVLGPQCAEDPPWRPTADGHAIRCWIPLDRLAADQREAGAAGRPDPDRPAEDNHGCRSDRSIGEDA